MKNIQLFLIFLFTGTQIIPAFSQTAYLTEDEENDVIYMLEEEKLARDVYLELGKKWDSKVFQNITDSEEQHYASVKQIAKTNNLLIPVTVQSDEKGKFENQDLQVLYDQLLRTGSKSLINALEVGAKIEELDIKDLDLALANTENGELTALYTRLKKASEKHLRAFTKNLDKQGVDYQASILTKTQYDEIVGAVSETKACCSSKKGKSCNKGKSGNKEKSCNKGKSEKKQGKGCCSSKK